MEDALAAARDFVRQRHPDARIAFLGGSVAGGTATPTSDLDILVLLDDDAGDVAYVHTTTHAGWLVEAFVYSPTGVERWLRKGRADRRPVLDVLAATGVPLTDGEPTRLWAERSREVLAAGPPAAERAELELRRYVLSDLLDDLEGGAAPAEEYVVAAMAFREAAELTLVLAGSWLGRGKWLPRNLAGVDDHGLVAWASGARDPRELATICRRVLEAAGGYLQDGFVRGDRPPPPPV